MQVSGSIPATPRLKALGWKEMWKTRAWWNFGEPLPVWLDNHTDQRLIFQNHTSCHPTIVALDTEIPSWLMVTDRPPWICPISFWGHLASGHCHILWQWVPQLSNRHYWIQKPFSLSRIYCWAILSADLQFGEREKRFFSLPSFYSAHNFTYSLFHSMLILHPVVPSASLA